jgi:carboxy-cis,cis-muconate cyclase
MHRVNYAGDLTVIGVANVPSPVAAPRTIVIHPSGKALYVVLEAWNVLAYYTIDPVTHLLAYTKCLYPLVPHESFGADYGSQSAAINSKGSLLWTSVRSRVNGRTGYINGFRLDEAGRVVETLFQLPTGTGGGKSNNLATSPFAQNLVSLAESERGIVTIWKYANGTARQVAGMRMDEGGRCCSEVVWVD